MFLLKETEKPVAWAYEAWDELVSSLIHKNNRTRAIAAQVLCSLAKSDPKKRILKEFPALLAVTKDERFVTARHCLQSLWKVGAAGQEQQELLVTGLEKRFQECVSEKNGRLIRSDIIQALRDLFEATRDIEIFTKAKTLIVSETDIKYRSKYFRQFPAARK